MVSMLRCVRITLCCYTYIYIYIYTYTFIYIYFIISLIFLIHSENKHLESWNLAEWYDNFPILLQLKINSRTRIPPVLIKITPLQPISALQRGAQSPQTGAQRRITPTCTSTQHGEEMLLLSTERVWAERWPEGRPSLSLHTARCVCLRKPRAVVTWSYMEKRPDLKWRF